MKEIRDIVRRYEEWQAQGHNMVLATVVRVDGSAYRKPGARMLVCSDGNYEGGISGGCLDGDAIKKAMAVLDSGQPMLYTYDNMEEDDMTDKARVGCNGIVYVLMERLSDTEPDSHIAMLKYAAGTRKPHVLITDFDPSARRQKTSKRHYLFDELGLVFPQSHDLSPALSEVSMTTFLAKKNRLVSLSESSGQSNLFCEYLGPSVRMVVAGSGRDVKPLLSMAGVLGWETVLVDDKAATKLAGLGLAGCQVVPAKPREVLKKINPDENTVFVLMTHNYGYDKELLYELCSLGVRHVSLLGPGKKFEKILIELGAEGRPLSSKQISMVCCPAGLNIGATSPEEIALSIIAEIKSVMGHGTGMPLTGKAARKVHG